MFIAAIGGVIVIGGGALAHDDHSDYGCHSQYSDAERVRRQEEAKAKEEMLRQKLLSSREEMERVYRESMEQLEEEYGDIPENPRNAEEFLAAKEKIRDELKKRLYQETDYAQKRIRKIDSAISRINEMQLTGKKK